MGVYIKGMEMPISGESVTIYSDGRVVHYDTYTGGSIIGEAVPVPPHGRLIDADALERVAEDMQKQAEYFDERARQLVCDSGEVSQYSWAVSLRETYRRFVKCLDEICTSTIIEAEEGET